jgi:hypothetical protein
MFGSRPTETVDPLAALVTVTLPGASAVPDVKVKTTASPARANELVAKAAKHARAAAANARRVVGIRERYHAKRAVACCRRSELGSMKRLEHHAAKVLGIARQTMRMRLRTLALRIARTVAASDAVGIT